MMAPSSASKPRGSATQQTLFGFFSKSQGAQSTPSKSNGVTTKKEQSSPVDITDDGSLTPPPTVRKGSASSSTMRIYHQPSTSPVNVRSQPKPVQNGSARNHHSKSTELTPPSSSPPQSMDLDDDQDDMARAPRRRATAKRSVKYVESDEEEEGMQSRASSSRNLLRDDDDDEDCFQPERENGRTNKKGRWSRGGAISDSDDEFDDFIEPDDELLGGE